MINLIGILKTEAKVDKDSIRYTLLNELENAWNTVLSIEQYHDTVISSGMKLAIVEAKTSVIAAVLKIHTHDWGKEADNE